MSTDTAFSELRYPALSTTVSTDDIELARVHGHAAGYAAGLRAAEAEAAAESARVRIERAAIQQDAAAALRAALGALSHAAAQLTSQTAPVLAAADHSLLAAAVELAESILGAELASGDRSARAAIARAMACADPEAITAVRLNPVDLAVLGAHDVAAPELRFVADPTLSPGDAVVEIADGRVDARVSSALERARLEIGTIR